MLSTLFPDVISELHRQDLLAEAEADRFVRQALSARPRRRIRSSGRIRDRIRFTPRAAG